MVKVVFTLISFKDSRLFSPWTWFGCC